MKKTFIIVFMALALIGCSDKKSQEKSLLDDIIKVHDKVMGADGQLIDNKMKLDTLLKLDKLAEKDTAKMLILKLAATDSAMDTWMNNFKSEYKGKTDDETVTYMSNQKKQIMAIDSQISAVVAESNKYLLKIKGK
jgi:hypothetical protein